MRITYAATLTADAQMGDTDNPNDVNLTWKRTNTTYFDTLKDCCHVYTYGIDILKQFSDNGGQPDGMSSSCCTMTPTMLHHRRPEGWRVLRQGLYRKKADATTFVPNSSGHIVKGLEDDTIP